MRDRIIERIVLALFAVALLPGGAIAQSAGPALTAETQGRVDFRSGPPGAENAAIWGYLSLPPGTGRVPAMVLMHGSSGLNSGSRVHYSQLLNRYGIAAFYVDSFTGRGLSSSVRDQSVLSYVDNTRDAFVALRLLRGHPRIDPARIGVMGFSRGGTVTWAAALRDAYVPFRREGLTFALHVAYYPGCNFGPTAAMTGAPMLFLLGGADNWVSAQHCLDFIHYQQRTNPRIEMKVYPGAHHAWDSPAADMRLFPIPGAQNVTGCDTVLTNADGSGLDPKTGRRMSKAERDRALEQCRKSSTVNVQPNRAIRAASDGDLIAFLRRNFRL
jgi:dienelactone hydrolase